MHTFIFKKKIPDMRRALKRNEHIINVRGREGQDTNTHLLREVARQGI